MLRSALARLGRFKIKKIKKEKLNTDSTIEDEVMENKDLGWYQKFHVK